MNTYKTDTTEFGLLLPNGQVLWNNHNNHSLNTPADRDMMVQVLRKTAEDCGFTEDQFLSNYSWVSRRVKTEVTDLGTFLLTDPRVIGVDAQDNSEDDEEDDGIGDTPAGHNGPASSADYYRGDLREGSLGGVASGTA